MLSSRKYFQSDTNDILSCHIACVQMTYIYQRDYVNGCHRNYAKIAIAFSQAKRILRIRSDHATEQSGCNELIGYIVRHWDGR